MRVEIKNKRKKSDLKSSNPEIRLQAYNCFGFTEEAYDDEFYKIRHLAYDKLGWKKGALVDESPDIRYNAYVVFGFTEAAYDDKYNRIRLEAYNNLGWITKAFKDKSVSIRFQAFRKLGFIKAALNEEKQIISESAKEYFEKCSKILGYHEVKTDFTIEEIRLLELNDVPIEGLKYDLES